jgi:hypothetical protein
MRCGVSSERVRIQVVLALINHEEAVNALHITFVVSCIRDLSTKSNKKDGVCDSVDSLDDEPLKSSKRVFARSESGLAIHIALDDSIRALS